MRATVLGLVLLGLAAVAGSAADHGEPQAGAALAQIWCASCHVIGTDNSQTALADAPAFPQIAQTLDERRRGELVVWLIEPHGAMPNLSLTRAEIANLLAYIKSLAPKD